MVGSVVVLNTLNGHSLPTVMYGFAGLKPQVALSTRRISISAKRKCSAKQTEMQGN